MPASLPIELRQAAVAAYDSGEESGEKVAQRFGVCARTLRSWSKRLRETGSLEASPRGGGNFSNVQMKELLRILKRKPDANVDELTRAYNKGRSKSERIHRSSILRALKREGFVFKKNVHDRPSSSVPTSKRRANRSNDG